MSPVIETIAAKTRCWNTLGSDADPTYPQAFSPFTGEVLKEIGQHPKVVTIMEMSPDMKWMATGSEDGTVIVWELGNQSQCI